MKLTKKVECRHRSNGNLGSRIEAAPNQLNMMRDGPSAAAVQERNLVYAVSVKDEKILVGTRRILADHARVVELQN